MPTDDELLSHVLRRCTFGPTDGQLQRFAGWRPDEVIDALLDDEPGPAPSISFDGGEDDGDWDRTLRKLPSGWSGSGTAI